MTVAATESASVKGGYSKRYRVPLILLLLNTVLFALWSSGLSEGLAEEGGVLETLQLLLAAGSCSIYTYIALEDDSPFGTAGAAMAAMTAIAILREIDVRRMVVPEWMMVWGNSLIRDTTIVFLLAIVAGYAWMRRQHYTGWLGLVLRRTAWPFWLSVALLASSVAVDGGRIIAGPTGTLLEEVVELNGFVLLLVAAWRHCHLSTRGQPEGA